MTYFCELVPVVGDLKIYDTPDGYDKREPFMVVIGVTYTSDTEVILRSAEGQMSRRMILAVATKLISEGIRTVCIHRKKGRKMPFGVLVKRCEKEDVFEVDLVAMREKGLA
jgi:hypothetical protein